MKQLWNILVVMLAINFLAVAAGVGWLYGTGRLEPEKVRAIREILFPKPAAAQATTQPSKSDPTTRPTLRLEEMLAKVAGGSAGEQVEFIQHAFDERLMQLDRRQRELDDLQRQMEMAKAQITRDRAALEQAQKKLEEEKQSLAKLQNDKGFQDSLKLYMTMRPKQVKDVFATMDDKTVLQYLQAMPPRTAAAILKEFKTSEETNRIRSVLEAMRQSSINDGR